MRFNSSFMVLLSVLATTALAQPPADSAVDTPATKQQPSSASTYCVPNGNYCNIIFGPACCSGICLPPSFAGGVSASSFRMGYVLYISIPSISFCLGMRPHQ